jgi:hypothetical protein
MPSLSKKYKINYNKRYTTSKNKKQRGYKSIKVYNRVKPLTRKRKHYKGGDIEVPAINNIFPSGQTYQPNTDCLEKECYKKDDAGEKTNTCLNTRIVMNLFSQNLDASEEETINRIDDNFTEEERKHVKDLTEKYLTNYVDSLFSKSIFSKNNVDLTPGNAQKLKELLEVIKPEYVEYLTQNSNLSDDIKEKILAVQQVNIVDNVVDNALATPAPDASTAPIDNALATPAPDASTAPIDNALATPAPTASTAPIDNSVATPAPALTSATASNTDVGEAEQAKKAAEDAEAERLRVIAEAEQAKRATLNETLKVNQTKIEAIQTANNAYADAIKKAKQVYDDVAELANQELDKNIQAGMSKKRYDFIHDRAITKARKVETTAINNAEKAKKKAIADAETAETDTLEANKRKILAKKNNK